MLFPLIATLVEKVGRFREKRRLMGELTEEYRALIAASILGDLGDGFEAAKIALEEVYLKRGLSLEEVRKACARIRSVNLE